MLTDRDRLIKVQDGVAWWYRCARDCMSDEPPAWVRNRPRHLSRNGLASAAQRLGAEAWERLQIELRHAGL